MLTPDELLTILHAECKKAGSVRKWAAKHKLTRSYVYNVLSGSDPIGLSICLALGYRRKKIVAFEKMS